MKIGKTCFILLIWLFVILAFAFWAFTRKSDLEMTKNLPATKAFSIGENIYFEIPEDKIITYPISEDQVLFFPSSQQERNVHSLTDVFNLTPTVLFGLNKDMLQGERIMSNDASAVVNVLNGPFYLQTDSQIRALELKIEDYICCKINYTLISENSLSSESKDLNIKRVFLSNNVLDSQVIGNINDACLFPLCFGAKPLDIYAPPIISIIPRTIIDESLFLSAKKAKCILVVDGSDYVLLVGVLKGSSSYIEL